MMMMVVVEILPVATPESHQEHLYVTPLLMIDRHCASCQPKYGDCGCGVP